MNKTNIGKRSNAPRIFWLFKTSRIVNVIFGLAVLVEKIKSEDNTQGRKRHTSRSKQSYLLA